MEEPDGISLSCESTVKLEGESRPNTPPSLGQPGVENIVKHEKASRPNTAPSLGKPVGENIVKLEKESGSNTSPSLGKPVGENIVKLEKASRPITSPSLGKPVGENIVKLEKESGPNTSPSLGKPVGENIVKLEKASRPITSPSLGKPVGENIVKLEKESGPNTSPSLGKPGSISLSCEKMDKKVVVKKENPSPPLVIEISPDEQSPSSDDSFFVTDIEPAFIDISSDGSDEVNIQDTGTNIKQDTEVSIIQDTKAKSIADTDMHIGIPVYSRPSKTLTSKDILGLCFGEVDEKFVCREKPVSVRTNGVFVVDFNALDPRSIYADDNGVWRTSTPRSYYKVEMVDGKISDVKTSTKHSFTHSIKRQYGTHQASYAEKGVTFQRIISSVVSVNGQACRYGVVQYIHRDGCEDDVVMNPHGNAKNLKRPFYKSDPDLIEKIKEEPLETKPRKTFKKLLEDCGGPVYSGSASVEPRNLQQLYNLRKSARPVSDDISQLIVQIKSDPFVHDLTIDTDSVQYVLVTEKQLQDLERFCTGPLGFSVFSIDSTYNIGNYYVTNTCYENLKVVHADGRYRGKHPMEFGPTCLVSGLLSFEHPSVLLFLLSSIHTEKQITTSVSLVPYNE